MDYSELEVKKSYINQGPNNFADNLLVPALKCTRLYERSVGYFSSGVFNSIITGIMGLVKNHGHIHIIASPQLTQEDINAIKAGYDRRELIKEVASRDITEGVDALENEQLQLLVDLISEGVLDVRIADANSPGEYHDKLGILTDNIGQSIVFYGSPNESDNGYRKNYEKIRLSRSWNEHEVETVLDEKEEFKNLWEGTNPYVSTYIFNDSLKKNILKVIERNKERAKEKKQPIELRDYQEEAIDKWMQNNYHGFYTMATGTGKTWTAIYSAKKLQKEKKVLIVICAPYKHLIKQWTEDLVQVYPGTRIIMVSSENPGWDKQIGDAIIEQTYKPNKDLVIVSTIKSFNTDKFINTINKSCLEKLLIVDEAHRFTNKTQKIKDVFQYMLGLSATPYSGSTATAGKELINYFGGEVCNLPIEVALKKHYLVEYEYIPIYVNATLEEEKRFKSITKVINSCFVGGKLVDKDKLVLAMRNRLRIIAMASEKQLHLDSILDQVSEKDHLVVYCGDGKLFNEYGEEVRHIQEVKRKLTEKGYKTSQFTCTEDMQERMKLVNMFNEKYIDSLSAIRCLDEGINIPSIKAALILASGDDYREFVQRRGRILRKYEGKKSARIYDVIVLPSADMDAWAKIELRRYLEYAKLATNHGRLLSDLDNLLTQYGLAIDDIDVYDYENMEVETDE